MFALLSPSSSILASTSSARSNFADLDVPTWAWIALGVVIAAMLGIDLYRHRDDHEPTPKQALGESLVWVACGLSFGVVALRSFSRA